MSGYYNWRLPNKDELKSIVYCSNGNPSPFLDFEKCNKGSKSPTIGKPFNSIKSSTSSWTSSEESEVLRYVVDFKDGSTHKVPYDKENLSVRCVRSSGFDSKMLTESSNLLVKSGNIVHNCFKNVSQINNFDQLGLNKLQICINHKSTFSQQLNSFFINLEHKLLMI